ncbi:MAG: endonuclease domain-containing protein [Solirubrobacteraceae bacterium]
MPFGERKEGGESRLSAKPSGPKPRRSLAPTPRTSLSLVAKAQLPAPETNVRIGPHEVDALWREHHLVVEIDGFAYHSTRAAFERDRARDAELQARGLRVMRVTWRQLVGESEAVVARAARALAATESLAYQP